MDNKLIINQWSSLAGTYFSGTVDTVSPGAWHDIRVDYQRAASNVGSISLEWEAPNLPTSPVTLSSLSIDTPFVGFPIQALVEPSIACGTTSKAFGSGLTVATSGITADFTIHAYDAFTNRRTVGGDTFVVEAGFSTLGQFVYGSVADNLDGTYNAT